MSAPGISALGAFYTYGICTAARFRIHFTDIQQQGTVIGMRVADATQMAGALGMKNQSAAWLAEQDNAQWYAIPDNVYTEPIDSGWISMASVFGVSPAVYRNSLERFQFTVATGATAGVSDAVKLEFAVLNHSNVANKYAYFVLEVAFDCEFYERRAN